MNLLARIGILHFFLFFSLCAFCQTTTVSGTVVNAADNTPIEGVSVKESGTKNGAVTDKEGHYRFAAKTPMPTLIFSSVGHQTYTVKWTGEPLSVKLEATNSVMQDVVVVGYGTQKKVNQTGSTQTAKFDESVNQPVTNTGQLMAGKFAGVQLTQASGLPGADASSIVIRGIGTFGATTPLVVIDNIQYIGLEAFNNLSPSDIETISVLKDASASSIYGARGANGVIVVTTKKGKSGTGSVIYNNYFGVQQVTVVPHYLDAVNYARLKNEHDINLNGANAPLRYTDAEIQSIIDGTDPDRFANTNWAKAILRNAPVQNHYLAFSGGNDKTTYRLSVGYLDQQAVVQGKFKSQRYTLGLNLSSTIKDWLTVTNVTNAYWSKFKGPTGGADAITGETGIINQFQRSAPTIPVYYSNGEYGIVDGSYLKINASFPATHAIRRGYLGDFTSNQINIADRLGLKVNFTKQLSFEVSGSVNLNNVNEVDFSPTNSTYDWAGNLVGQTTTNTLKNNTSFNYRLMNENILRYATVIAKNHDLSILLGHSVNYYRTHGFAGSLQGFPSNALQEFNAGGVLNPNVSGGSQEEALQSFFGRVNYIFNRKYLFEFNLRRDGSSKFGPNHKYGTFPSASAGWRISEENFVRNVNWVSDLKLRGSWGITGNDNINNYIFDQTYNAGLDYFLGTNTIVTAVALTSLANPTIRWETVKQVDLGLDATFLRNKLSLSADYFQRNSYDLLYAKFPVPSTLGVTNLAAQNAASMTNSGVEVVANYRNKFKQFGYEIGASVSKFNDNKVTGLGDRGVETINAETIIRIGQPFNAYYGYKVLGIFQSAAEVTSSPTQATGTAPGDFKFADLSGPAGKPDGKIDAFDKTVIGNPYPKWIYNFNANVSFKGIDFSVLFEGVKDVDRLMNDNGQLPMDGDRNNALSYWVDRWTPTHPSTTLPRLGGSSLNSQPSDFYIEDVSYLRLKNIEIGYTLPAALTKKIAIAKFRFFVSGQNTVTFTKFKNFDPERAKGGNTDQLTPLYKVLTVGLNVKF